MISIDVPEDIARYIMCKEHEWTIVGKDYSSGSEDVYVGKCKHCGKPVSSSTPLYEFKFSL